MSNVFTSLVPTLFGAARETPRELTGYSAACNRNFNAKGAAQGDIVKVTIAPVMTIQNTIIGQTFTVGNDRTPTTRQLQLNQAKEVTWNLKSEEEKSLENSGVAQDLLKQTIEQGIRTIANTMEAYFASVIQVNASRVYGTPGTTPFATTIGDLAQPRKILKDNGVSVKSSDISLVCNTNTSVNLESIPNLFKVNESGTSDLLRLGEMGKIYGNSVRESAQIIGPTVPGTGTSYVVNNAGGYAIGATSIILGTGTGTIIAGDFVTFAGDTNKYLVVTGIAAPGTIVIQEPGLMKALANTVACTVGAARTCNHLLARNAACIVARPALQPEGAIAEQMTISDPQTGFSFLLLRVPGSGLTSWYMRVVYDAFTPNPYAIAELCG